MKASNIYQTLKTKGHTTGGAKPQLPGIGSPLALVKMNLDTEAEMPSEATVGSNPKRAMRQAERRAKKGYRQAKKDFRKCKRSRYGSGKG